MSENEQEQAAPTTPDIPAELGGNPLSDEDVRRQEHPEEFEGDADDESAKAAPLTAAATTGPFQIAEPVYASSASSTAGAADPPPDPAPAATPAESTETASGATETADDRQEQLSTLGQLERDVAALRRKLFGASNA